MKIIRKINVKFALKELHVLAATAIPNPSARLINRQDNEQARRLVKTLAATAIPTSFSWPY